MADSNLTARWNTEWSRQWIATCLACGCDHFFVAPGSRSTPLTYWLSRLPSAQVVTHFDERSLAFACLGYGRAAGRAGVFICTSGTAAANALPAVVEASLEHVPMLLLTADRPPELQDVGANQAIRQAGIFGNYPVWSFDFPCPTAEIPCSSVRSTAVYACERSRHGPVHINCMFREPLLDPAVEPILPVPAPLPSGPGQAVASGIEDEGKMELEGGTTIVLAGSGPRVQTLAARCLADRLGAVFLADITSMLHERAWDLGLVTDSLPAAETVIHVGGRLVSQAWHRFIAAHPPVSHVHFHSHGDRIDPHHLHPIRRLLPSLNPLQRIHLRRPCPGDFRTTWQETLDDLHEAKHELLANDDSLHETAIAMTIGQLIPEGSALFLGNSMPIRDFDQFATWDAGRDILLGTNRGASGIDGLISTAVGFALGSRRPTTAVLGDLSFLHDLNALAMARRVDGPIVFVVINNNGGGIFHFLPIASALGDFERLFAMPHGLTSFAKAAELFEIPYVRLQSMPEFQHVYRQSLKEPGCRILEVPTDRNENLRHHRWLRSELQSCLARARSRRGSAGSP